MHKRQIHVDFTEFGSYNQDKMSSTFSELACKLFHSNQKSLYNSTRSMWQKNAVTPLSGKEVKYLLICEAPPSTGKYFYSGKNSTFLTNVWKAFFNDKLLDLSLVYKDLADEGFLLVDTLPYAMNYSTPNNTRGTQAYDYLISACRNWWIDELDKNFKFACPNELKIAFGFRKNAISILKGPKQITLNGLQYVLPAKIAEGMYLPTSESLRSTFPIISS